MIELREVSKTVMSGSAPLTILHPLSLRIPQRQFVAIVEDPAKRPVLVHCAQGVRRTGMMVAAYERSTMGWDAARAKSATLTFGHSQRTVKDVERFIDGYNPQTSAVPDNLPIGTE